MLYFIPLGLNIDRIAMSIMLAQIGSAAITKKERVCVSTLSLFADLAVSQAR
ncbi:MAG: hypothetical protein NTW32_22865 [Chloroflexi bacterium]|nr:hypothetical protein [Chloroflexota bacterium]